jgi:UDP-N-acetylglucosamine 2-epimerase (non-hydrolysing)
MAIKKLSHKGSEKGIKVIIVAGARPNFMKLAPLAKEMRMRPDFELIIVHTGQHYDKELSKIFFTELDIPEPDINLDVGSGTHAQQTAEIMKRFEPILLEEKPDFIMVVGDVNSTIACALTASKLGVKIIHVEAGLRSFDRSMPEEINRVLTDTLSDILFTTERSAEENLLREGIPKEKIFFVGNVMIDTLLKNVEKAKKSYTLKRLGLNEDTSHNRASLLEKPNIISYAVLTLHRPNNVDRKEPLIDIFGALSVIAKELPIVFPVHPRTKKNIHRFGLDHYFFASSAGGKVTGPGIFLIEPLGYLDFLHLMANSRLVLTDSGGMQEETTVLGIPCVTLRENTERPITVTQGTNKVVGSNREKIIKESLKALNGTAKTKRIPRLWDGRAAERIVKILSTKFQ